MMARIRTIKPEFWTNERVMECSANARLLFIGMWNFADDLGRLSLAPKTIKAQIFPSDDISLDIIRGMIQELSANGLLLIYEVDAKEYLQIVGWQHQRIDKPQPGKCPGPTNGYSKSVPGTVATDSILPVLPDPIPSSRARAEISISEKVLKTDLMEIFGPDRTPNLSKAGEWLSKGYSSTMILEVVRELLARKPDISSLAYFEPKLAERHANQPPSPSERAKAAEAVDMDKAAAFFKKTGVWWKHAGPEPGQTGCKCPPEILAKHGIAAPELRRMDS